MAQIFHRSMNTLSRVTIFGSFFFLAFLVWACLAFTRSSYGTGERVVIVQPIPFSHEHHVGILGIDCRYCHTSVENSSFAGMPATKTCMNCHSQIWVGSDMLKPVRDSYASGRPIRWGRVNNLPGFVYFDHSIHIHKGVGCVSCHGRVDQMPLTYQAQSLLMEWCLDCHRHPEQHVRPREEVFNLAWEPAGGQAELGPALVKQYGIKNEYQLTSCSVCHR
jgi:Cytochrome c7 and related cytochrome c